MKNNGKTVSFIKTYNSLTEVLTDHKLASLGDSFINFAYSLALSERRGTPEGKKVKGTLLAEALRRTGLRGHLHPE
jgi:Na+-transporting NADH:ubiquinone oxidoreductase subunit NqrF